MKRIVVYGALGGALLVLLKLVEYQHFVRAYPSELYGGLLAVLFAGLGIYLGSRWHHRREERTAAVRARPPAEGLVVDRDQLERLGITPREHEILGLIAEGLSNREIGERLFISENTVKTHSSRVFGKLGVRRRVQAVQAGRALGLVP